MRQRVVKMKSLKKLKERRGLDLKRGAGHKDVQPGWYLCLFLGLKHLHDRFDSLRVHTEIGITNLQLEETA